MSDDFQSPPPAPPVAPPPAPPVAPPVSGGDAPSDTGKILAVLGYIFWPVALIAVLIEPYKNERFVRFHAVQALGLSVAGIAIGVIANIPILGWIVALVGGIALFVLAIMGLVKALQGEYYEMPVVYGLVKSYI